ncbi:sphingosine N-acyltransferase [Malassezia sp. CBS 17886]|nr:sphingosine N-acyltransferase [Malassezia sp. CBS 17886]
MSTAPAFKKTAVGEKEDVRAHPRGRLGTGVVDFVKFRWLVSPTASFTFALSFVVAYFLWQSFVPVNWNPVRPFLFLSYKIPDAEVLLWEASKPIYGPVPTYSQGNFVLDHVRQACQGIHGYLFPHESPLLRYSKGVKDIPFIFFYILVFSFLRQVITQQVFKPLGARWGLRSEAKQTRFAEQGYALFYWGLAGTFGVYVMTFQDSWWYNLDHLWYQYPHWQMRPEVKLYYLLQFSYWLQQALVMFFRLERPRKDYYELVAHHIVTLWLVGWSYFINLTMIGTTVFVCMDIPDIFLALSKMLNYLDLNAFCMVIYGMFMCIWTYFRIYLSARTLYSVWSDYHKIPAYARSFNPFGGFWLVYWMQCHVFAPLLLLLLLNLFWYALMWRILYRYVHCAAYLTCSAFFGIYGDTREEHEEGRSVESKTKTLDNKAQ